MLLRLSPSSCKSCIFNQLQFLRSGLTNNASFRVTASSTSPYNFTNHRSMSTKNETPLTSIDPPASPTDTTFSPQTSKTTSSYFVARTKSKQLPIYETTKHGGNLAVTTISHVSGDIRGLSKQLQEFLGSTNAAITMKSETNKIFIRGRHKVAIKSFLEQRQL